MACVHLQQLYQLCQQHQLRLSSSDLVHIVCDQCGKQEVCPSGLMEPAGESDATEDSPTHAKPASAGRNETHRS